MVWSGMSGFAPHALLAILVLAYGARAVADDAGVATPVVEELVEFHGPLRARDLSPFGYLRLDMRPSFLGTAAPGTWFIDSEIAYQNSWAVSPATGEYLASRPGRGRSLTTADLAAIEARAPENYLVDLELAQFSVVLHRQLSTDWGAFLVLGGVNYGGGLLDSAIEKFHETFGLENYGRSALPRGEINVYFDLEGQQYRSLDAASRSGLLDPTLGVRYSGIELSGPWQLVLEAATKLPLGGERPWLSTGKVDAGLQATVMRRGSRHAFYGSTALVWYAGSSGELPSDSRLMPTMVAGVESRVTRRTHSVVQMYVGSTVYDEEQTSINELLDTKYQLSVGLRHNRGRHVFSFAVTENISNMQNTPDIGMQVGWVYRPQR